MIIAFFFSHRSKFFVVGLGLVYANDSSDGDDFSYTTHPVVVGCRDGVDVLLVDGGLWAVAASSARA